MATIVAVMDRGSWDANTDCIVLVDPAGETLLWIPRDLWCDHLGRRINGAFASGGASGLLAAMARHGWRATDVICLRREATEAALRDAAVTVPVARELAFWYPLSPVAPIEDGRRLVTFRPPSETLRGERIHQWLGARYAADPPGPPQARGPMARLARAARRRRPRLPDLERIERQQIFVRALLLGGFDFSRVLATPEWVSCTGPGALDDLRRVHAGWRFRTLPGLEPRTIDGVQALVRTPPSAARRAMGLLQRARAAAGTGRA